MTRVLLTGATRGIGAAAAVLTTLGAPFFRSPQRGARSQLVGLPADLPA